MLLLLLLLVLLFLLLLLLPTRSHVIHHERAKDIRMFNAHVSIMKITDYMWECAWHDPVGIDDTRVKPQPTTSRV